MDLSLDMPLGVGLATDMSIDATKNGKGKRKAPPRLDEKALDLEHPLIDSPAVQHPSWFVWYVSRPAPGIAEIVCTQVSGYDASTGYYPTLVIDVADTVMGSWRAIIQRREELDSPYQIDGAALLNAMRESLERDELEIPPNATNRSNLARFAVG